MCVQTSRFVNVSIQINTNMRYFHPLDVVGRGSETIQVGENINYIT